jgi:hypothetical protein
LQTHFLIKKNYRDRVVQTDLPNSRVRRFGVSLAALSLVGIVATAWATGWPPFASPDSIEVVRGGVATQLTSGAASVLDNDIDFEDDRLTAVLDKDVKQGVLELREDGTFRYEHNGSGKDDKFSYRAFDGTRHSQAATVSIEIVEIPNTPPVVTGEVGEQQAIEGIAYRLELSGYFDDPDEGDLLQFSAQGLPESGSLTMDATIGVLFGTPVSGDVSDNPYDVRIIGTDRAGASAELGFLLWIFRDNRTDIALNISLAKNPVMVGEAAEWEIRVENRGPADLDEGQLTANWASSGPALALAIPDTCAVAGNSSSTPEMSCAVGPLAAGATVTFAVTGTQESDGDNSLIGIVTADDDPIPGNNSDLASAQVVALFSEGPTQSVDLSGFGVDTGDVNGDGATDIVATADQTYIFLNNGHRAVTTPGTSLGPGSGGSVVTMFDWNGDASPDIAVGGLAGSVAGIFVNDRSGGFSSVEQLQSTTVGSVNDIAGTDLDNDGRSELVLTGSSGTAVFKSRGEGGFDELLLSSGAGLDLAVSDIDQDGDLDLVVVRAADRAVDLHFNVGDGTAFSQVRLNHGSVATACAHDLNGDGAPDLLLGVDGDDLNAPENKVLLQQGDGSFAASGSFGASPVSALVSGDIDIDGWPDIVAVNSTGVHQLYLGSSGSEYALAPEQIISNGMHRGILADFNADGSLDLIMVGGDASVLEIHANNGVGKLGLGDRIAPDLQLLGDAVVTIQAGVEWVDPGATAVDDIDGDISDQIELSAPVNTAVVGTQRVTYSVKDRAGNSASAVRTVNVGVNEGTGGGGGGAASPFWLTLFALHVFGLRRRSIERKLAP